MTKFAALIVMCISMVSCGDAGKCRLCGKWKSDAAQTLEEMKSSTVLTEEQRKLFMNDFFGKLTVEMTPEMGRAYFEDQQPSDVSWGRWEVVIEDGDKITIRSEIDGKWKENEIYFQGNCYRIDLPHRGFGEWFCRLPR